MPNYGVVERPGRKQNAHHPSTSCGWVGISVAWMGQEMDEDDIALSADRVIALALGTAAATWLFAYALVVLRLAFT